MTVRGDTGDRMEFSSYPPIADYGFLSDCEVTALVAPSGSVEWMCLPRLDGPSVFGSLLDRDAAWFRFGPADMTVPADRRYLPGTMVLETSWDCDQGWIVVQDCLVMGPWRHEHPERGAHARPPTDYDAEHTCHLGCRLHSYLSSSSLGSYTGTSHLLSRAPGARRGGVQCLRVSLSRGVWKNGERRPYRAVSMAARPVRARLPSIDNIKRRVRGHEAGENHPGDLYIELYCRAFGLTREALFGSSSPRGAVGETPLPTEHDAIGLATWITASNTSDEAISRIDEARAALAEAHTSQTPGRVLADVLDLHRQVQALLHSGRQRSGQTREMFRIEADLLAHASLLFDDMDHDVTAKAYGETAGLCAEEADYSPAFALSAQAKTARWQGVGLGRREGSRYFARSADLARQGFEHSPHDPVRVLLANQEASASALLGDATRARRALRDAQDAASSLQTKDSGLSTWSCPGPRQALYALSVAIRLRDPDEALRAVEMADIGWVSGEPWLHAVWSLVRIGAGISYVMKGDLDAAAGQLSPVLTLAPEFRITTITNYLADMDSLIAQRRFADAAAARVLREQIAAFKAGASPATCSDGQHH